jgi:hypothetical protein
MSNYRPVEDPTVELDAAADNVARGNVAMMTHTATRAWVTFTASNTTGGMALVAWDAMWKAATTTAPTLVRNSIGSYTIGLPATVNDELGTSHSVTMRAGWVECLGGATLYFCQVQTAASAWSLYTFDTAFALVDPIGCNFTVFGI